MAQLTIIGLGPGDPGALTLAAHERLTAARVLYARAPGHPALAALPAHVELRTFDQLAQQADSPAQLEERIAAALIERAARGEPVHYAVPGHPLVAEATTRSLLRLAARCSLDVEIIDGLSFIEPVCRTLGLDPLDQGLQLLDALDLLPAPPRPAEGDDRAWVEIQGRGPYRPALQPYPLQPTRPALLCHSAGAGLNTQVLTALLERYPPGHHITLISWSGANGRLESRSTTLAELQAGAPAEPLLGMFVPALPVHEDLRSLDGLQWVIQRLMGPHGCPWDREQTHHSLRPYLLEETHETLEALDAGDDEALSEELGDLLLQILLHAEMGRQDGRFDFGTISSQIAAKLIRRHPHVFGDVSVDGAQEVVRNWEAIKATEQQASGKRRDSLLDGIPAGLPALAQAHKLTERAAKVGFDWHVVDDVWGKLHEELDELRSAAPEERAGELGDLLFAITNLARWLEIDSESALRETNAKFRRRFQYIERQAAAQGRTLKSMSLEEMDGLWDEAKRLERDE